MSVFLIAYFKKWKKFPDYFIKEIAELVVLKNFIILEWIVSIFKCVLTENKKKSVKSTNYLLWKLFDI